MKTAVKSRLLFALSLFAVVALVPAAVFGAPKKKKGGGSEISCAEIWNGAAEKFYGKTVKTFVLGIGAAGTASSAAAAAVVPVETGDANRDPGGNALVLVPPADFSGFAEKFAPRAEGGSSSFGKKIAYRLLAGTFAEIGGENVLLLGVPAAALKDFSPSRALKAQLGADVAEDGGNGAGGREEKSSREGYEKRIFSVAEIGKKPGRTAAEFRRLVALFNRGKRGAERMSAKEIRDACGNDAEFFLTVFDEKAKIEWEIRN